MVVCGKGETERQMPGEEEKRRCYRGKQPGCAVTSFSHVIPISPKWWMFIIKLFLYLDLILAFNKHYFYINLSNRAETMR